MDGFFGVISRCLIFIFFFNATNKHNIFGLLYLIGGCIAWKASNNMNIINKITTFTIMMLLMEYLFLVLNINPSNSPMKIPENVTHSSIIIFLEQKFFPGSNLAQSRLAKIFGFSKMIK